MSDIQLISAQVFRYGHFPNGGCNNPVPYSLVSAKLIPVGGGPSWFKPYIREGIFDQYQEELVGDAPSADSVQTVRLWDPETGGTIWVLGTEAEWSAAANACCGATPVMPPHTVPDYLNQEVICAEVICLPESAVYNFTASGPEIVSPGQKITLTGNQAGVAFTPAAPAAGFASRDLALAWANANWGAYGEFTAVGDNGIKLAASYNTGGFDIVALDQPWCMTIVNETTFNQVKNGAVVHELGRTITVTSAAQVIAEIDEFFGDGTLTAFSATKINYLGTNAPGGILLNGVSVAAFAAGACA